MGGLAVWVMEWNWLVGIEMMNSGRALLLATLVGRRVPP